MGKSRLLRWAVLPVLALALALIGCSKDNNSPTTTGDVFTVSFDGGAATTYTEAAADNTYGYEPYIVAWLDTVNTQIHVIVASGVSGTGVGMIVAATYDPPTASGVPVGLNEVRYEENWNGAADPLYLDDVNGTITITTVPNAVGDLVEGTFDGFTGFTPAGGPYTTLSGTFKATRGPDDLF